jgi:mono/diheme cytochrome c family protein
MSLRLQAASLLAVAALAGCGGGGGGGDEAGAPAEGGQAVFAEAGCGGCHVLEEAGSSGSTGPALDGASLSVDTVADQVRNGGGGMPSFSDELSEDEIQQVAEFVSEASQD